MALHGLDAAGIERSIRQKLDLSHL